MSKFTDCVEAYAKPDEVFNVVETVRDKNLGQLAAIDAVLAELQRDKDYIIQQINGQQEPLLDQEAVLFSFTTDVTSPRTDGGISTRVPTSVGRAGQEVQNNLVVGLKSAKLDEASFNKNATTISGYTNFKPTKTTTTPERIVSRFISHLKNNLLWLFDQVPQDIRDRSKLWYDGARNIVTRWEGKYNLKPEAISGVIAALSPQKDWFMNVSLAERLLDTYTGYQEMPWTPEMTTTAKRIFAKKQYQKRLNHVRTKKLKDLYDPQDVAMWIRAFDETYNDRGYRIVSPEGNFMDQATNLSGAKSNVAWGSLGEMGKAVSVLQDDSFVNISKQMGIQHKVRNFYNNIVNPNAKSYDVTIDTHAVAAALLRPLSGYSKEVTHNFGGAGASSSSLTGNKGTYPFYAEAYRRAALERGILPREMQSITWEAVRGLFPRVYKQNAANVREIEKIWEQFRQGRLSLEKTRNQISEHAGGIAQPTWAGHDNRVNAELPGSSYTGKLDGPELPRSEVRGPVSGTAGRGTQDTPGPKGEGIRSIRALLRHDPERSRQPSQAYSETSEGADGRIRITPTPELASALKSIGADAVTFTTATPQEFLDAQVASLNNNPYYASVEVKDLKEYAKEGMRLYLTEDGSAGFALTPDRDIVAAFKNPKVKIRDFATNALSLAIDKGGRTLDAFDTTLPEIYGKMGFQAVSRVKWNDEYKPKGWDYELYSVFNGGRPDVVLMVYNPDNFSRYQQHLDGQKNLFEDWDDAVKARSQFVTKNQLKQPEVLFSATAKPTKNSKANVTQELREEYKTIPRLLRSGKLVILDNQAQAKEIVSGLTGLKESQIDKLIAGFTDRDTIYLVADGTQPGTAKQTFIHEAGVHVARLGMRDAVFQRLLASIPFRMREISETGVALRAAAEKVGNGPNFNEEVMAYAIEHHPEVGIVKSFIARIKKLMADWLGGSFVDRLTIQDLRALAQRASARPTVRAADGTVLKSEVPADAYDDDVADSFGDIEYVYSGRPDSSIWETILSSGEYIFQKYGATRKMFQAALDRRDRRYHIETDILNDFVDQQNQQQGFTTYFENLKKNHKESYAKVNEYLLETDKNGDGFSLVRKYGYLVRDPDGNPLSVHHTKKAAVEEYKDAVKEGKWKSTRELIDQDKNEYWFVYDREGEIVSEPLMREDIGVEKLLEAEAADLVEQGYTDQEVDAVMRFRMMTNRAFDYMIQDLKDILERARELGQDEPTMPFVDEERRWAVYRGNERLTEMSNEVDARRFAGAGDRLVRQDDSDIQKEIKISDAIAMMGDRRGSYFPRQRDSGAFVLRAERGTHKILKKYDFHMMEQQYVDRDTGEVMKRTASNFVKGLFNRATGFIPWVENLEKEAKRLKKLGYKVQIEKDKSMPEDVFDAKGLVSAVEAMMDEAVQNIESSDAKTQEALEEVNRVITMNVATFFKSRGFLSSRIERTDDYWEGFETDLLKAGVQYAKGIGAGMAKREASQRMVAALTGRDVSFKEFQEENPEATFAEYMEMVNDKRVDPTDQKMLYRESLGFMQEVLRNDEQLDRIMGTLKGLAVIKFLGFRISSAAVNMANLAQAVPATISSHSGGSITGAFKSIGKAAQAYTAWKTRGKMSESDRGVLQEIVNRGWDSPLFNQENTAVLQSKVGRFWNGFNEWAMKLFSATEKVNRAVTILAAYNELAKNTELDPSIPAQREELLKRARHVSDRAHGVYGKHTMPAWTRGAANPLKLLWTFQKFSHNYMLNMAEMGLKGDYKQAAYMLMSPAILAGTTASILNQIIISLLPEGSEEDFYNWVNELGGESVERFARHGAAGLLGVNLKGSLQMNNPMPTSIEEIFGAPGGVVVDTIEGYKRLKKGQLLKAGESLLPTAFGNLLKGAREGIFEGVSTGSYSPVFYGREPLMASPMDTFIRMLSFNPSRLSGIREKQWNEKKVASKLSDRRREVLEGFKRYRIYNRGNYLKLIKEMRDYNELARGTGRSDIPLLTPRSIDISIRRALTPSKVERERR